MESQVSTLPVFMSQAIILPITGLPRLAKRHTGLGNASILAVVCPCLAITRVPTAKPLHYLSPADEFMLQETTELLVQLQQTCQQLEIEEDFSLSLLGQALSVNHNIEQHQNLANALYQSH